MSDASCTWTIDTDSFGECEAWRTDCGNRFVLIDGTPSENGFRFCPYCGRALVEAWPAAEVDWDEIEKLAGSDPDREYVSRGQEEE